MSHAPLRPSVSPSAGFTLLELLVALAIVAVLAATSVPQFRAYRARAFDFRAQSDLRNVAIAEEAYFVDAERYLPCRDVGCSALPGIRALSKGVVLSVATDGDAFVGTASHPKGTGKTFNWDSDAGGFTE